MTSIVLSFLLRIYREGYDMFNPTLREHCRNEPLKSVDSFIGSLDNELPYESYLQKYLNAFLKRGEPHIRVRNKYLDGGLKPIARACPCNIPFECLYVLKEILSYLDPQANQAKKSLNNHIFEIFRDDISQALNKNLIQTEDGIGWVFTTSDTENVDPYVTARILGFLSNWGDRIDELKLEKDFGKDSKIFHKCLETVKRLQVKEDSIEKYNLIDRVNVKGSWREREWGEFHVWRLKGTSDIAKILYQIEGRISKEINEAESFLERIFGKNLSATDASIFSDGYEATVSDITGTISIVDFYLSLGKELRFSADTDQVVDRIRWLLDQQGTEGAWPVLSIKLWDQETHKDSDILRKRTVENNINIRNVSACNTILMINMLIDFLKQTLH